MTLVQKRFSINGKTNTGSALGNHVIKGPESVIPAKAGIQRFIPRFIKMLQLRIWKGIIR